jgi:hypothetical protein
MWYGTNRFNARQPAFRRADEMRQVRTVIRLGEDGYSIKGGEYFCEACEQSLPGRSEGLRLTGDGDC